MPVSKKFSPKDEYHIHLKLYEPLNNPLLIQYLDAFWQIYQQVEKAYRHQYFLLKISHATP